MLALGSPWAPSRRPSAAWTPRDRAQRAVAAGASEPSRQASAQPPPAPAVPQIGWLWDRKSAQTRKRLQEQQIRPKKSLGQNFMLDDDVLASIVAAAAIRPGDLVLEIGPGTGNLTRHLLAAGALVTAVEKDYALSDRLAEEFADVPQLRLVCGDILRQDLPALLAGMRRHRAEAAPAGEGTQVDAESAAAVGDGSSSGRPQDVQQPAAGQAQQQAQQAQQQAQQAQIKVVANLPYYITKDCLLQMLPMGDDISALYFMLQDEVGVRLTQVDPGAADWRAMNLLTQYYCQAQYLFRIDRRKYHPAPKVHGAVVRFALTPPARRLAVPSEPEFIKLVKKAFSQRRKVVRNALRPLYEPGAVAAALAAAGLSEDARAQDLTLQQFGELAWALGRAQGDAASEPEAEAEQQRRQGTP